MIKASDAIKEMQNQMIVCNVKFQKQDSECQMLNSKNKILAAAANWETEATGGGPTNHLAFKLSSDGGRQWLPPPDWRRSPNSSAPQKKYWRRPLIGRRKQLEVEAITFCGQKNLWEAAADGCGRKVEARRFPPFINSGMSDTSFLSFCDLQMPLIQYIDVELVLIQRISTASSHYFPVNCLLILWTLSGDAESQGQVKLHSGFL